jgi:citrate lyase subunit beta/citryl-CoA lyase
MAYARGKFVCDARAAGLSWLIDGAFMNLAEDSALERECALARTFGFNGKVAIHPRQVAAIQAAFSPTAAEIERAKALIDAFREAEAGGRGAFRFRGMMVDYANVRRAEQLLALSER